MKAIGRYTWLAALIAVWGCQRGDVDSGAGGPTRFVSADAYEGQASAGAGGAGLDRASDGTPAPQAASPVAPGTRSVEEGDIYRVLDGRTVLNLNAYRGLQIIDISNLDRPRIVGRLGLAGTPVELYADGDRAWVLLNGWHGYYGTRDDVRVEQFEGGLVVAVDLSAREAPRVLARATVPGSIRTSRMARQGATAALYVASQEYGSYSTPAGDSVHEAHTIVRSLDASADSLTVVSTLDLGGYVQDIQATPDALLVARQAGREPGSQVAVIDISDPRGRMVEGASVSVAGRVESQFNMDLRGSVLRIASGSTWNGPRQNHLETFDVTDLSRPSRLAHCTYGAGQQLFATLFVDHRAFFVTYERVDPFHAFFIGDDGRCEEKAEFVVSGWNDFFRAVLDETRLLGIGVNDEGGRRRTAVSLYDITRLDNPRPLVARVEVEAERSWSEANWDHRAFSVIENAVDVRAADGSPETGLLLLPFTGYSEAEGQYTAAVQIFSYGDHTLTRRGLMAHGTPVRRTFQPRAEVAANLSEAELSLFGTADVDAPTERGRVELAPSVRQLFTFGAYRARVIDRDSYGLGRAERQPTRIDVLPRDADPNASSTLASLEVPGGAQLYQVGALLVAVDSQPQDTSSWPYTYRSSVDVYDFSDPRAPRRVGGLTTDRLMPSYAYGYGPYPLPSVGGPAVGGPAVGGPAVGGPAVGGPAVGAPAIARPGIADCFGCGGFLPGPSTSSFAPVVAGDSIVFPRLEQQEQSLGSERVCSTYAVGQPCEGRSCGYIAGGRTCRTRPGEPELCEGEFVRCPADGGQCEPVEASGLPTETRCYDHDRVRYWNAVTFDVLDLREAAAPRLHEPVELPRADEAAGVLADGAVVYHIYRRPVALSDDPRPHVAWYVRPLDVSGPSPGLGRPVNVPGQLVEARGERLVTQDLRWGTTQAETVVYALTLRGRSVAVNGRRAFEQRRVEKVVVDDDGHVLVSHGPLWGGYPVSISSTSTDPTSRLAILSAEDMALQSEVAIDAWARLADAALNRALFQVSGGLLVMDLSDPTRPRAQAFFPVRGWPSDIKVDGDDILLSAGRYGAYRFGIDARNLLTR